MREQSRTCCFTGHRPEKLPWGTDEGDPRCRMLKKKLYDAVAFELCVVQTRLFSSSPVYFEWYVAAHTLIRSMT